MKSWDHRRKVRGATNLFPLSFRPNPRVGEPRRRSGPRSRRGGRRCGDGRWASVRHDRGGFAVCCRDAYGAVQAGRSLHHAAVLGKPCRGCIGRGRALGDRNVADRCVDKFVRDDVRAPVEEATGCVYLPRARSSRLPVTPPSVPHMLFARRALCRPSPHWFKNVPRDWFRFR